MGKMSNLKSQISNPHVKSQILRLGLISIVTITVGIVIGLILNYQTIKELREEPAMPSMSSSQIEEKKEKIATYSGKIKPSIRPEIAAHYLEDDNGEIIVFLKSGKIESGFLGILEGQTVEVVGEIIETKEDGQRVLEVDEVHL